ncbi:uncharacterized protein LOC129608109 [Condylostylus longicornis]|uniref:uncharacterized protein LOC129608109 n=1 Tax=Condylostylus longicornis TaxID=2530218 RepID=UPI00244DFCB1|nr:uncharacterized protein LOC129608109 [Condylostylus longicornis]
MKLLLSTCRYPFQTFLLLTAFLFFNYFISSTIQSELLLTTTIRNKATKFEIETETATTTTTTAPTTTNTLLKNTILITPITNNNNITNSTKDIIKENNKKIILKKPMISTSSPLHNNIVLDANNNNNNQSEEFQKESIFNSSISKLIKTSISNLSLTLTESSYTITPKIIKVTTTQLPSTIIYDGSRTIQKDILKEKLQLIQTKEFKRKLKNFEKEQLLLEKDKENQNHYYQQRQQQQEQQQQSHYQIQYKNSSTIRNNSSYHNSKKNNSNIISDNIKIQHRHQYRSIKENITKTKNNNNDRIGVILFNSDKNSINTTTIQLGFEKFLEFFQLNLTNRRVDFIKENGLNNLIKHLENKNYTTIIKTLLTNDISEEENEQNNNNKNSRKNNTKTNNFNNNNQKFNNNNNKNNNNNNNNSNSNGKNKNNNKKKFNRQKHLNSIEYIKSVSNAAVGLCHLSQGYLKDFNKTVLMWPCPNMKTSGGSNFLPSYEAISFAVKSIVKKLDWTEALILVPDTNWGLPLAISANLDITYQMEIGSKNLLQSSKYKDKIGKVIIVTSPLNDPDVIEILKMLEKTIHTNILLIDIYATAFNSKILFYKNLMKMKPNSKFLSNIFILTILSEKYRLFLDVAFEDEMKSVKNLYHTTKNNEIKNGDRIKNDIKGKYDGIKDATLIPDFTTFKCQNLQKLEENTKRLLQNEEQSKNFQNLSYFSSSSSSSTPLPSSSSTTLLSRKKSFFSEFNEKNPFTPVELLELCKSENLTSLIENANKDCTTTNSKFIQLKWRASSVLTENNKNDNLLVTSSQLPSSKSISMSSLSSSNTSHRNNNKEKVEKEDENNVDDQNKFNFENRNLNEIETIVKKICKNSQTDLIKWNSNIRILKDLIDFFHLYDFIATNLITTLPMDTNKNNNNHKHKKDNKSNIINKYSTDIDSNSDDNMTILNKIDDFNNNNNNNNNKKKNNNVDDIDNNDYNSNNKGYQANDDNSNINNAANQIVKFNFIVLDINERCININDEIDDDYIRLNIDINNNTSSKNLNFMINNSEINGSIIDGNVENYNEIYRNNVIKSNNKTIRKEKFTSECNLMWRPFLILEQNKFDLYVSYPIHPQTWDWDNLNPKDILVRCGTFCWILIGIAFVLLLIIIVASVALGIAVRNYLLRRRLSRGPNKIVLSANDFVFPVENRRVDEGIEAMLCCWLQQLQEFGGPEVDKPDLLKGSIGSLKNLGLVPTSGTGTGGQTGSGTGGTGGGKTTNSGSGSLARHNPTFIDMRARYNGDLVQLKEIPMNGSVELKSKAMDLLVMAHGLRHENINPLIGWLSDPSRTAMVFDFCSRGSLQDVLIMDEIKLDWSFRLSLLTDLVRGMRYLHSTPIRVHGSLTSRNCVVDARWVLKITDYGLATFYEAQGLPPQHKSAKELLWTAPELLRNTKGHNKCGTQMGDVYSFGIIMQEVVVRGEPYCMLSLSPEEIITKIKKPPPLIRPSVSKGAAPPEAINIMRQCWAEQPDMRPDFISVYERFKMLNHGRKVNFVDTMFQMLEKYSNNLEELIRERTEQLDIERKKTEQLLNRMLPSSVAEKLKMGLAVDPEEFSDVTIYFSDIVGFTTIAAHCSPVQVVDLLNDLYTIFDATINAYNVYKVETIGDAYMVVSGLPVRIPDHAEQIATMALDLLHQSGSFKVKHLPGVPLQLRIGLHTGPCCAGVVGLTMPRYCLFGDTVNTASRMESTGSSSRIHMSEATRDRLEKAGGYSIEARGPIEIKGKGLMNTFWLLSKKGFDKPLPVPPPIGESHGLDESLVNKCITLQSSPLTNANSTNPSSSQSSSLAGESVEVKVEITPPTNTNETPINIMLSNSYSLDSSTTINLSPNIISINSGVPGSVGSSDVSSTKSISPQTRKLSELQTVTENLLIPGSFNRMPASTSSSSSRIYKRFEEIMDLSLPYNSYKCLSPSENNLSQFMDGKYIYGAHHGNIGGSSIGVAGVGGSSSGGGTSGMCGGIGGGSIKHYDNKPGSSRLLRRQFSLDKDDAPSSNQLQQLHAAAASIQQALNTSNQSVSQTNNYNTLTTTGGHKQTLDIPILQENRWSPKGQLGRLHKQNSQSINQDLEKIEEIPMSPSSSSQQHSGSIDSNLNRSPTNSYTSEFINNERKNSENNGNNTRSPGHDNLQKRPNQEITLNVENLVHR